MGRKKLNRPPHSLPIVRDILDLCEGQKEAALCDRAGLSGAYISQLRARTVVNPSVFHLGCLAEALGYEIVLKEKTK